jgi:hypothetical protein
MAIQVNKPKVNILRSGFSIDETRVSVLIITYLIGFIITVTLCVMNKDTEGLKQILFALTAGITGVNVTNSIFGGNSYGGYGYNNYYGVSNPTSTSTTDTSANSTTSATTDDQAFSVPASGAKTDYGDK